MEEEVKKNQLFGSNKAWAAALGQEQRQMDSDRSH